VNDHQPGDGRVFTVKLRPLPHVADPVKALRGALKVLLRRFGLHATEVSETTTNAKEDGDE
jgi:hypothetical protein